MASIDFASELMTNYIAAVPVPAGSRFQACLDPISHRPMVFALSNDQVPKLQVIKENTQGLREILNFSQILRVPESTPIQRFDVQQGPDFEIYLVIATRATDTTSNLYVAQPFQMTTSPSVNLIQHQGIGKVHGIYLSRPSSSTHFPALFVTHQPLHNLRQQSDITHVMVDLATSSLKTLRDMELPENAVEITSLIPAHNRKYGDGIYVLYSIQGKSTLVGHFVRPDPDSPGGPGKPFTVKLSNCPHGATALAPFTDEDGSTGLLIACDAGLHHFSSYESVRGNSAGTLLVGDETFQQSSSIFVSQDKDLLSVWSTNSKHELAYLTTRLTELGQSQLRGTRLLSSGKSSSFTACVTAGGAARGEASQMLISNDDNSSLTVLQQNRDTGIWKKEPFFTVSSRNNLEIQSYTISIRVYDTNHIALKDGGLLVRASSSTDAIVNGLPMTLSSTGSWVSANDLGELGIIVPTSSLSARALEIREVRDAQRIKIDFTPMVIDPSRPVLHEMSKKFKDSKTLKDAPLWKNQTERPSDNDLAQAAKCFTAAHQALTDMPASHSQSHPNLKRMMVATNRETSHAGAQLGDLLMDGFHWVKEKVHEAVDWVIEQAGEVWQFACKIGNSIKTFVLDCVEKIGEAASWLWEKLKVGWEAVKDMFGFLFAWDDIKTTKNMIKQFIASGLEFAADNLGNLEPQVDTVFDRLGLTFKDPPKPKSKQIGPRSNDKYKNSSSSKTQRGVSFNWTGERLQNGGAGTTSGTVQSTSTTSGSDEFDLGPLLSSIEAVATETGSQIVNAFKDTNSIAGDRIIEMGKDFVVRVINVLKQLAKIVIKSVSKLLKFLTEKGSEKINIPIFSALYEKISGSHLTIFDAVSLVLAIPATIMIKAITGKAPPKIDINAKMLSQYLSDAPDLNLEMKLHINTVLVGTAISLVVLKGVWTLVKFASVAAKEGTGGLVNEASNESSKVIQAIALTFDMIGIIVAMPNDPKLPGFDLRQMISYMTLFRAGVNGLQILAPAKYANSMEKMVLCTDLVVTLANFGLYQAVYFHELTDAWDGKDEEQTDLDIAGNVFNTLAGVGYFTAFVSKLKSPHMAAAGMAVMGVGTVGLSVMEGVIFARQYEKMKKTLLKAPAI